MIDGARINSLIAGGFATALCISSAAKAQSPYQPGPLVELLEHTDWVGLPLPDDRMGPGAIIRVTGEQKNVDVRWLGDFKNCGLPSEAFQIVRGKYAPVGIGKNLSVDVSLAANFLSRIGLGAEASKATAALLKIEDSGGDAVDLLALSIWLSKPGNFQTMPEVCSRFLAQSDVYLVSEAYRISKGSYELLDKKGAKLTFDAAAQNQGVKGQIGASLSSNGTLTITGSYYFAVRRVKQLSPGIFMTLGTPGVTPEADDLLRRASRIE
jgi:hypothetical protein